MTARTDALARRAAAELVQPDVDPRRSPRVRSWIVFALAVIVAFFGLIFSRISVDRSAFVLEDLEVQIATEEARLGDLRVEVARLKAPERISLLAAEMGLVYPAERISLRLSPTESDGQTPETQWAQVRSSPAAQP